MAKRHRTRARTRRGIEAARRTPAPASRESEPAPREAVSTPRPTTHRVVRSGGRAGWSRAAGAASQSLERAAGAERAFVVRDLRRLAIVVALGLVLLVLAGVLEGALLR